ncbi:iron ABC transporter permease, partial [Pseudomonas syringae pv. tagetis]
ACDDTPPPEPRFAGLGNDPNASTQDRPGRVLSFPDDPGQHPGYRIEWGYITATLKEDTVQPVGVLRTLFRSDMRPGVQAGSVCNQG